MILWIIWLVMTIIALYHIVKAFYLLFKSKDYVMSSLNEDRIRHHLLYSQIFNSLAIIMIVIRVIIDLGAMK